MQRLLRRERGKPDRASLLSASGEEPSVSDVSQSRSSRLTQSCLKEKPKAEKATGDMKGLQRSEEEVIHMGPANSEQLNWEMARTLSDRCRGAHLAHWTRLAEEQMGLELCCSKSHADGARASRRGSFLLRGVCH